MTKSQHCVHGDCSIKTTSNEFIPSFVEWHQNHNSNNEESIDKSLDSSSDRSIFLMVPSTLDDFSVSSSDLRTNQSARHYPLINQTELVLTMYFVKIKMFLWILE